NLLIEQVTLQQQEALGADIRCPLVGTRPGANSAVHRGDGAGGKQTVALARLNNQGRHPRGIFLRAQRHLAHTAGGTSAGTINRRSQEFCQRKGGHGAWLSDQECKRLCRESTASRIRVPRISATFLIYLDAHPL